MQELAAGVVAEPAAELRDRVVVVVERLGQGGEDEAEDLPGAVELRPEAGALADGEVELRRPRGRGGGRLGLAQALGERARDLELLAELPGDARPVVALAAGGRGLLLGGGELHLELDDLSDLRVVALPDVARVGHGCPTIDPIPGGGERAAPRRGPQAACGTVAGASARAERPGRSRSGTEGKRWCR